MLKQYRKALAALGGFCVAAGAVLQDGEVTGDEKFVLLAAAITAVGVWAAPNATAPPTTSKKE